jgi:hypothetical protein
MLTYVGKGYSAAFTENFDRICERLGRGEDILLVDGPDDVCAPLLLEADPHCHEASVVERDRLSAEAASRLLEKPVFTGSHLTLDAARLQHLRNAFKSGSSRDACHSCEWHDLCTGIAGAEFPDVRLRAG